MQALFVNLFYKCLAHKIHLDKGKKKLCPSTEGFMKIVVLLKRCRVSAKQKQAVTF